MSTFTEIVAEAEELKTAQAGRIELFDEMEAMWLIRPKEAEKYARTAENVKLTYSPDAANQLDGAVRLLVASDPKFRILADDDIPAADRDAMEGFADAMWKGSGKIAGTPAHYDMILSGLLYGETYTGIINMRKLAKLAQGKAHKKLAEQCARITPYMYETWSPRTCYPRRGRLGLTALYREVNMTVRQIRQDWGTMADKALGTRSGGDTVTYGEWWDLEKQAAWVRGTNQPILFQDHDLPFLPMEHTLTEGSTQLFEKVQEQLRPFLYKLAKSGLWNRENLLLTTFFTLIFAIGGNPMYIYRRNTPNKVMSVDWSKPGGVIPLDQGEDFGALTKNVIDPSLMQGMQMVQEKLGDSTMYKQALGQPMGTNTPYSLVALLSQSGRLPLISPQRRLGWMISSLIYKSFQWMRETGEGGKRTALGDMRLEFDPSVIPEDLDIQSELSIDLPQDKLSMANIAKLLVQSGLVSEEWTRSEVLGVENDGAMKKQIVKERVWKMLVEFAANQMIQEEQQKQQMAQGGGMPPGGMPPGAAMPPPQEPAGLQGMPPEMLAAGGQGPEPLPGEMPMGGEMPMEGGMPVG